jgi:type I restriction enzyme S subunit
MDAFAGAIGVSEASGKCSPVYTICPPVQAADSRFYAYYLRDLALSGYITTLGKGIRERSTEFKWKELGGLVVPLPPLPTQVAIANFLDRESPKLAALITNLENLIELLKEKRQAVISHAVTKGLDPKAKMRDSGVELIGEVPEHWEVSSVKRYATSKAGGTAIKSDCFGEWHEGLFPAFSASGQDVWMLEPKYDTPGIVLSAVGARCGKAFKADGEWNVCANTHCIVPTEGADRDFLWYVPNNEDWWARGGSAQPFVKVAETMSKTWAFPSLAEQKSITEYLDKRTVELDDSVATALTLISLLKEKRSALISEAVTGQYEIPEEEVGVAA